jgi:hypothetical protein
VQPARFRPQEKPGPPPIPPEWQSYIDSQWDKYLAANPGATRVNTAFGIRGDLLTGEASQPGDVVLELERKDFLSHEIITYNDDNFTVKQVLRVAANSLGGTHWGPNSDKRSEELRKYMEGSVWLGRPLPAATMFEIARCTVRTCKPLADELTGSASTPLRPASGYGRQTAIAASKPESQNGMTTDGPTVELPRGQARP